MPESLAHKHDKRVIAQCMSELGFAIIGAELDHADLIIASEEGAAAIENERSAKNIIRGVWRNRTYGMRFTQIVTPSFAVLRDAANKLHKDLPQQVWPEVGICTLRTLELLAGVQNTNNKKE